MAKGGWMMRTRFGCIVAVLLAGCMRRSEPETVAISKEGPSAPTTSAAPAASERVSLPVNPPVGKSAPAQKPQRLDSVAATQAARSKGLKVDLFVPYPVSCPIVDKPKGDSKLLAAKGNLAGLQVDMEGFLRADMGIAEAVELLGVPVLCNDGAVPGYLDMHLAPRDPSVRQVTLETHDGELIGVIVELENTVTVDMLALEKRYGKSRTMPGPHDSFEAGSDVFDVDGSAYRAYFSFAHRKFSDPPQARQVHEIIFRRTPMIEILPEGFHSVSDVARLIALTLHSTAPEAVDFAGTLGLYNKPVNRRVEFGSPLPIRNITTAAVVLRDAPPREFVQSLEVTFKSPIAGDAQSLARSLETLLKLPKLAVSPEGNRQRIDVADGSNKRGKVLVQVSGAGVKAIEIVRSDAP